MHNLISNFQLIDDFDPVKENGDAFDKPSHQLESQHKSLEDVAENDEDEDLNNEGNEVSFVSACAGGAMGTTKVSIGHSFLKTSKQL